MNGCWRRVAALTLLATWIGRALPANGATSYEAERELGRNFALQAQAQLPLVTDIEVVEYVSRIGEKIVATLDHSPFAYRFFVIRDPKINAFAVPGGYIYLHSGMLTRATTDDEVAGVLGHEIAHVHAHHMAREQDATHLMNYATLFGLLLSIVNPAIGAGAVAANAAAQLKYRREFEQEADYLGAGYMRKAGFDPNGMLDFFKKMADEQRLASASTPPYLLSHPLTDERLTHLESVLRTQQWAATPRAATSAELERVQVLLRAQTELPNDVLTIYRRRVDEQPDDAHARYLLGVAFLETGAFDSARQTLEQARAMGCHPADRELGRAWLRLREPQRARELLAPAVEIDPDDAGAHAELAKALETLGDSAAALREYQRAVELAPTFAEAHYSYGILAGRSGHEADGYFHLAEALRLRGEYGAALNQYEKTAPLIDRNSERGQYVQAQTDMLNDFLHRSRK